MLVNERQKHGRVRVGEAGTIREISISDPDDGDDTFLMFYAEVVRGTIFLHPRDFAPVAEAEAHLWARRQLRTLR